MKKTITITLLTLLVVPQLALASWYNPFTWSIFNKKTTNTTILEARVKELEQKLESASVPQQPEKTVGSTTTVKAKPTVVQKKFLTDAEMEKLTNTSAKNTAVETEKLFSCNGQTFQNNCGKNYTITCPSSGPATCVNPLQEQETLYKENKAKEEAKQKGLAQSLQDQKCKDARYELEQLNDRQNALQAQLDNYTSNTKQIVRDQYQRDMSSKITDMSIEKLTLQTKLQQACNIPVTPIKTYNTNCFTTGSTLNCTTY